MQKHSITTVVSVSALCLLAAVGSAAPSFTPLGVADGQAGSEAVDLSSDGSTILVRNTAQPYQSYFWKAGSGLTSLGTLPSWGDTFARKISSDGSTVAGQLGYSFIGVPTRPHAFRWTSGGGLVDLGVMNSGNEAYSQGYSVSANGQLLVGCGWVPTTGVGFQAFRFQGSYTNLGILNTDPDRPTTSSTDTNSDGSIVVGYGYTPSAGDAPFRWTAATGVQALALPPNGVNYNRALAISPDGSTIAGVTGTAMIATLATIWDSAGNPTTLGTLGPSDQFSYAYDVSSHGSAVVGTSISTVNSTNRAFLWRPGTGMVDLNTYLASRGVDLTGWVLTSATGVSFDGRIIVGKGLHTVAPGQTRSEGWRVVLAPACASDLNGDGVTNTADLALLLARFGQTLPVDFTEDVNRDGQVTTVDLSQLLGHFGQACPQ